MKTGKEIGEWRVHDAITYSKLRRHNQILIYPGGFCCSLNMPLRGISFDTSNSFYESDVIFYQLIVCYKMVINCFRPKQAINSLLK